MNTIEKGIASKELLENPLLKESLDTIREAIISQWTITVDPDLREELWFTLAGTNRFETLLRNAIENGRIDLAMKEKYHE
jgi:hypothetical protein